MNHLLVSPQKSAMGSDCAAGLALCQALTGLAKVRVQSQQHLEKMVEGGAPELAKVQDSVLHRCQQEREVSRL